MKGTAGDKMEWEKVGGGEKSGRKKVIEGREGEIREVREWDIFDSGNSI